MTALDEVVGRLRANGCNPRRSGDGWAAKCPAHDDKSPSLSLRPGDRHEVVLKCHAGCRPEDVLQALGLSWPDLCSPSEQRPDALGEEVGRFHYELEHGVVAYDMVRFPRKEFRPELPDGTRRLPKEQRIPYRLPDVFVAKEVGQPVYVAEGEGDCDSLMALDEVVAATTNPFGALTWLDQYDQYFLGIIEVRIIADRDDPGYRHALDVGRHLAKVVEKVTYLLAREGKDARDHLNAGHGLDDLIETTETELLQKLAYDQEPTEAGPDGEQDGGLPAAPPNLAPEFWDERPSLRRIRQAAHSRLLSSDALLQAVLARVSAYTTPHTIELPAIVGAPAPLSTFVALIGGSGSGKSAVIRASRDLIAPPEQLDIHDLPLGTGEGLGESFMGEIAAGDGKSERAQVRHHVMLTAPEGEAFARHVERQGATLAETLRRAWSGDVLGQANASQGARRVIPAGSYRLGLIIGLQPELAGPLLGDAAGGTPQRFLWAAATDPAITADAPGWPDDWPDWHPLDRDQVGALDERRDGRHPLVVADEIKDEIKADRVARAQGIGNLDVLDGHALLLQLKVAALLALLDGHSRVGLQDWRLARIICDMSRQVRAWLQATLAAAIERDRADKIDQHARREGAGAVARNSAPDRVEMFARRLARHVHAGDPATVHSHRDLAQRFTSTERHLLDAAIARAVRERWITDGVDGFRIGPEGP